jgi:hypothetical protein
MRTSLLVVLMAAAAESGFAQTTALRVGAANVDVTRESMTTFIRVRL